MKSKINTSVHCPDTSGQELSKNKLLHVSKKILVLLAIFPFIFGCDPGTVNYNNPNIPNYPVNLSVNINLPQYNNLQFPGNYVVNYSQGARGIVIFNTGSGYNAFDLACPNQAFTSCSSAMSINGIEARCNCDDTESPYSLYSGQSPGQQYTMKPYRVEINGANLVIYNN